MSDLHDKTEDAAFEAEALTIGALADKLREEGGIFDNATLACSLAWELVKAGHTLPETTRAMLRGVAASLIAMVVEAEIKPAVRGFINGRRNMERYTASEAASAIAAKMFPNNWPAQESAADAYRRALMTDLFAGQLIGRDATTYLPVPVDHPVAAIAFVVAKIDLAELNHWLRSSGVPVELADEHSNPPVEMPVDPAESTRASGVRNPQRSCETRAIRLVRLTKRKGEILSGGASNFVKILSGEEGVSETRIKQDLRVPKVKSTATIPWTSRVIRANR